MVLAGRFSPMGGIKERAFRYTTNVPEDNYTQEIPIVSTTAYIEPLDIDWGDGTKETLSQGTRPTHTYASAGNYQVSITSGTGKMQRVWFRGDVDGNTNTQAADNLRSVDYVFCKFYNGNSVNTDFRYCFNSCLNISGSLPRWLFYNNPEVTSVNRALGHNSFSGSIPEDLFENNVLITDMNNCFSGNTNLSGSIPANLLKQQRSVTIITSLFNGCTGLTGTIPSTLFTNCVSVTTANHVFSSCSGLSGAIPSGLFDTFTSVTTLQACFTGCSSLTEIPSGLFDYCVSLTSVESLFYNASGLTGKIPDGLFSGLSSLQNVANLFYGCSSLTTVGVDIFKGCVNILGFGGLFYGAGITNVPEGLFDDCVKATSFSASFRGTPITSVPSKLFAKNVLATNFSSTFNRCNSLTIPSDLFCDESEKSTRFANVTPNFTQCFYRYSWTGSVAGTAPDLWNYTYASTPTTTQCYAGAANNANTLTNYADIPAAWK